MKVLISGATGFIGSHLVERFLWDYEVRAMAHYRSSPDLGNLKADCEVVRGDIRDERFVENAVAGCNLVVHLAALVDVPYSFVAPRSYLETNCLGIYNVLEACLKYSIPLITTSSSEVYGTAVLPPINETHRLFPQSPYATTKLTSDNLAWNYHLGYGLPVVILRPFNTYGPRQSDRAVLPSIIKQLRAGSQVRLGNIKARRDWLYVDDSCEAYSRAASYIRFGQSGLFNIGTGISYSVEEAVQTIGKLMGVTPEIIEDQTLLRPGASEVENLQCDYYLAKKTLDWEPKVSFEEGLRRTIG
jgi:nucleoside-diphosphate-sugar epimerase